MSPLVLVPCSYRKTLPVAEGLRGRDLQGLPAHVQASVWRDRLKEARPRLPVRTLYKGGAWSMAREAAATAARYGGSACVVSAGLGMARLEDMAPGYDITFAAGSPDIIPGGTSPEARANWWLALDGASALDATIRGGPYDALLVALPETYLDAVAPSLAPVIALLGANRVSVLTSKLTPFSRRYLAGCWVPVMADQTTALRGNAGQSTLAALLYVLRDSPADADLTRPAVEERLGLLARRGTPLYPKRDRLGGDHARGWIDAAIGSDDPPRSASEALRRYRQQGFAFEQKAFHRLFAEVAEATEVL